MQTAPCRGLQAAQKRLQKELRNLKKAPLEHIAVEPSPRTLLDLHFVLLPPPTSAYQGGEYHGIVKFPPQYPYKASAAPQAHCSLSRSLTLSLSRTLL